MPKRRDDDPTNGSMIPPPVEGEDVPDPDPDEVLEPEGLL